MDIRKITNNILIRISENFGIFLALWYGGSVVFITMTIPIWGIKEALLHFFLAGIEAFLCFILLSLFRGCKKFCRFTSYLLLLVGALNILVDYTVIKITNCPFRIDHVALVMGTNSAEGVEFFQSYFSGRVILLLVIFEALYFLIFCFSNKGSLRFITNVFAMIGIVCIVAVSVFTNVLKSNSWGEVLFGKVYTLSQYEVPPDLSLYVKAPKLVQEEDYSSPANIVVIFGESFSKGHSSLYGYDKDTNPMLGSLEDLIVYSNVDAAETHTIPAFKLMLSTNTKNTAADKWFEKTTIFSIADNLSRKTTWISNQSRSGIYDNIVSEYAELANKTIWVGENLASWKKEYDEVVLPFLDSINTNQENLVFVHLLGSHFRYDERYPGSFSKFSCADYPSLLDHQKENISTYDNSIFYNDFVVYNIISHFRDVDAIVIYLSDHGQDLYQSSDDFCGHGVMSNPVSWEYGRKVPFLIYPSRKFIELHCSLYDRIRTNKDKAYDLEDLLYTLSDLMGIKSIDDEIVSTKSLFR